MSTRRSAKDFLTEAVRAPYELGLDSPPEGGPDHVKFTDINKIPLEATFGLYEGDVRTLLRSLLSEEDYKLWWAEWQSMPSDALNGLLGEIRDHFGADEGKAGS
jgi:hypothetical protein